MCTVLSPRSCLRGTPGSRVGGPVSHDWTFPAFKFGRGLLVLVLVEAKSTARQQNFFRSPMPLPNFRDRLWRPGPCKGEVNGAPAKLFSVPGASVKILLSCAQSLRSPVPLSKFCSPVRVACWSLSVLRRSQRRASKTFFGPRCLCQIFVTVGAASWSWCLWRRGQQRASKILFGLRKSRCAHFLRQTQCTPEENFRPSLKFLPNQNKTKIPNLLL